MRVGKVIGGGMLMGAVAVGVFHQGTLFLLFHIGHVWPALVEAVGRPPFPGWDLARLAPGGWPLLPAQMAVGALWGVLLAAILRFTPAPDLLAGVLVGLAAALALPSVLDQGPDVARAALAGAGWGWGCAVLLRPVEVRRYHALKMRHPASPKD